MYQFILKIEVTETIMPAKIDWLGLYEEKYKDEDFKVKSYEEYFSTFELMSKKIDEITEGYYQYWADVNNDIYENDKEYLEYHSDYGQWDREITIRTERIYLTESFWEAIKSYENIK